jgi:hypothetical protein
MYQHKYVFAAAKIIKNQKPPPFFSQIHPVVESQKPQFRFIFVI